MYSCKCPHPLSIRITHLLSIQGHIEFAAEISLRLGLLHQPNPTRTFRTQLYHFYLLKNKKKEMYRFSCNAKLSHKICNIVFE